MKVTQSCPTLYDPMEYTVQGILQARILEWVAFPFSRGLLKPGIAPRFPTLQADSLPAESSGKPKNTGVSSLSLLQWIFPTQEWNRGLLHCRQILYQLSYQGSPNVDLKKKKAWCMFLCQDYEENNTLLKLIIYLVVWVLVAACKFLWDHKKKNCNYMWRWILLYMWWWFTKCTKT